MDINVHLTLPKATLFVQAKCGRRDCALFFDYSPNNLTHVTTKHVSSRSLKLYLPDNLT
jgi:hypothetical protein